MKKLNIFTSSLLAGLFASSVFANEAVQTEQVPQPTITQVQQATVTPPAQTAPVTQQAVNPNLLNINTASAAEIQDKLVGIGAKKAQAIVDYRTKNGAFSSVEQLKEVSGIGEATLEKNRSRIVLQ